MRKKEVFALVKVEKGTFPCDIKIQLDGRYAQAFQHTQLLLELMKM